MQFKVHSVPPQQFAAWAQSSRSGGQVLDGRAYAELVKPSSYVKPMTYGNVAPGLFGAIVSNTAPPPQQLPHNPPTTEQGAGHAASSAGRRSPFHDPIPLITSAVVLLAAAAIGIWVWRKGWWPYLRDEYITSTDHKRIGIMYIVLALLMLVRGSPTRS